MNALCMVANWSMRLLLTCPLCCRFDGLSDGDHILVVDAGGGTTDMVVYRIAADQEGRLSLQQEGQPYMLMKVGSL